MKKNIIILTIAIAIFIIALIFFIFSMSLKSDVIEEVEDNTVEEEVSKTKDIDNLKYQDFTIYKEDGTEVKLSDYKDTPVMILFFNKNTEDSMEVLNKVEEMYKNYETKINFLMINTSQDVNEELKDEYTIEIYYDFYKEAARNYNITELPSMIYINEDNEVFNAKSGLTTTDALEANLDILSNNI